MSKANEEYFDMTNQNARGFTVYPAGRYQCEIIGWTRHIKDNGKGNHVHWIDLRITDGKFKDDTLRYFQTIVPKDPDSPGYFSRMVGELGLITEADRTSDGKKGFGTMYGPPQDNQRGEVVEDLLAITPNKDEKNARSPLGTLATAVVIQETDDSGDLVSRVKYLNAPDPAGADGDNPSDWL